MPYVKQQASEAFRQRVEKTLPGVLQLDLNSSQWQELQEHCLRSRKKRLTAPMLLRTLALVLDMSEVSMARMLSHLSPRQHAAPQTYHALRRRYTRYSRSADTTENRLLLSDAETGSLPRTPLKDLNVRVVEHLLPATPDAAHRKLFKTPGKKTRVYPFFTNRSAVVYKPVTPEKEAFKQVRGEEHLRDRKPIAFSIPKAVPIQYTCTLQKLIEQAGRPRRTGQNQLVGGSCKVAFQYCAEDGTKVVDEGNQYHWSHLIARFLGGADSVENLIPGTAASNYETLGRIERFIAQKLMDGLTEVVHVTVTPLYQDNAFIADELTYTLKWKEKNTLGECMERCETHAIRPRSYQRITRLEEKMLEHMRQIDSAASSGDEPDDENIPPSLRFP